MKNKNIFIMILILLVIIGIAFGGYVYYKSHVLSEKIPELIYLNVCGKDIPIKKGKRVYKITMDSCTLKYENGGWPKLISYKFDDDSNDGWSVHKEEPGEYVAYDFIRFDNTDNSEETYDYYISAYFATPIVKESIHSN